MATTKGWLIIDGGGTHTGIALVVGNTIVARGDLQSYKPVSGDLRTAELCSALQLWLARHVEKNQVVEIANAVVGMSGVWGEFEAQQYVNSFTDAWLRYIPTPLHRVSVISDVELVRLASLGANPGIVLIAGTGSIALGILANGTVHRCGGWGPTADDVGAGYWLGREAVSSVLRMLDGRAAPTTLIHVVSAFVGVDPLNTEDLAMRLRGASLTRIAKIGRAVLEYADEGDNIARNIRVAGAKELTLLVTTLFSQHPELANCQVVLYGSLFSNDSYRTLVTDLIRRDNPTTVTHVEDAVEELAKKLS